MRILLKKTEFVPLVFILNIYSTCKFQWKRTCVLQQLGLLPVYGMLKKFYNIPEDPFQDQFSAWKLLNNYNSFNFFIDFILSFELLLNKIFKSN